MGRQLNAQAVHQSFCFQNKIKHFLDTLIQKLFLQIMKMNKFRGDLTDISAKTKPLLCTAVFPQKTQHDFFNQPLPKYQRTHGFRHILAKRCCSGTNNNGLAKSTEYRQQNSVRDCSLQISIDRDECSIAANYITSLICSFLHKTAYYSRRVGELSQMKYLER